MDNAEQLAINWDLNDTGYRGNSKSERHPLLVEKKKVFLSCSLKLKSLIVSGLYRKHLTINHVHFHSSTWQCKRKTQGLNTCQGPLVSRDMSCLSL